MRRIIHVLAITAVIAMALSACGGGHSSMSDGEHHMSGMSDVEHKNARVASGARVIEVRGKTGSFIPTTINIKAGEDVAIKLQSTDAFHDFVVDKKGHVVGAERGKTQQGGLRIDEAGTYKFWCSVAGHRKAGMEGTLVVT